ncbi:MAG: hypothetical protein ISS63_12880 [Desulfobacteraceae bacterium]|nr:hypothetical protein [Desulfobacteraceae bacterium]
MNGSSPKIQKALWIRFARSYSPQTIRPSRRQGLKDEIAGRIGTINYEVVCSVGKRVPRIYVK